MTQPTILFLFLFTLFFVSCDGKSKLNLTSYDSSFVLRMSELRSPFDQACFVRSEYNQFYFGNRLALLSEGGEALGNQSSALTITHDNISKRGYNYLIEGYNPAYLLLVLQTGDSYTALPVYGPKIEGKHALQSFVHGINIASPKGNEPRACTKDRLAVAKCIDIGGRCIMLLDDIAQIKEAL